MKLAPSPKDSADILLMRAQSLAMLNQKPDAFDYLEKYIAAAEYYVADLENDRFLVSLKKDAKFKALVEKAKQKSAQLVAARTAK